MDEMKLVTQRERQRAEMATLLSNQKYAREAARTAALTSLYNPIDKPEPVFFYDKNGEAHETEDSVKKRQAWDRVKLRCKDDQDPTLWDLMNEGIGYEAITNPAAYAALRDTAGLKPIDESKVTVAPTNPLENLTMDQLELLKAIGDMPEDKVKEMLNDIRRSS